MIVGAWALVNAKVCDVVPALELAVMVIGTNRLFPADVPEMVAVPLPLSRKPMPVGSVPVKESVGDGAPVV